MNIHDTFFFSVIMNYCTEKSTVSLTFSFIPIICLINFLMTKTQKVISNFKNNQPRLEI